MTPQTLENNDCNHVFSWNFPGHVFFFGRMGEGKLGEEEMVKKGAS